MARIGVYRFLCKTGRFYIGSSQDIDRRKSVHLRSLRKGKHHNIFFQRVFDKYGEESFKFQTILTDTLEEARLLEQQLLDKHFDKSKCMNIGANATGGDNLTKNPNRSKILRKIKSSLIERLDTMSDEERRTKFAKFGERNGMYGRTHSPETRKLLSAINTGRAPSNKGVPLSEAQRKKISEYAKTRIGEMNSFYGKSHSPEMRKHLSVLAKQRIASGMLPPNTRRVKVGRKIYRSLSFAAKQLGVVAATVLNRIRSDKFPNYTYLD